MVVNSAMMEKSAMATAMATTARERWEGKDGEGIWREWEGKGKAEGGGVGEAARRARNGRGASRPPTPITAGGLFHSLCVPVLAPEDTDHIFFGVGRGKRQPMAPARPGK